MLLDMRQQSAWPNVFDLNGGTGSGKTGTIAVTEADDAVAAFGIHGTGANGGFVTVTEADDTAAAVGVIEVNGAAAITEPDDAAALAGIFEIDLTSTATLALTEPSDVGAAVGRAGNVWANIDGNDATWSDASSNESNWAHLTPGAGLGDAWETSTILGTDNIRSIWYDIDTDLWVACGDNGVIYRRQGLGEWEAQVSGVSTSLRTVKKWNGYWWICGHDDTLIRSADAVTWTDISSDFTDGSTWHFVSMTFSDDLLVIVGWRVIGGSTFYSAILRYDTDGFVAATSSGSQPYWYGATYNPTDDEFIIVGEDNGNRPVLLQQPSSFIGSSRTFYNDDNGNAPSVSTGIWSIDWNGINYVIGTGAGEVRYSTDLESWMLSSADDISGDNIWRITNNGQGDVILCGGYWNGKILRSADNGETFTQVYENFDGYLMSKAFYGPGFWLAVGWNGQTAQSINSQPWSNAV